jgi:hypothetical protein
MYLFKILNIVCRISRSDLRGVSVPLVHILHGRHNLSRYPVLLAERAQIHL